MSKLQPVRGTHDILPDDFEKFHAVIDMARRLAMLDGFKEMTTPIFEPTEVFSRSMGETSDVVSKEMFTFTTKGEESVTLRPEFTAGVVRSFISNGMQQNLPLKLFSTGPLFRYERPQKGRQRQFHQVNYEWLGDASPEADVELILLAGRLLYYLSGEKGCTLLINTLGDHESRENYRQALMAYLAPHTNDLSPDSQRRLTSNPLRILDSKDPNDKKILENAPKIIDYLSEAAKQRFETVCNLLRQEDITIFQKIKIDATLVRGLDYYSHTVFEFVAETGDLGAQNTVLAGGRYDGLVELMGGKPTPAIGFAAGVERLLLLMQRPNGWIQNEETKIVILPFDDAQKGYAILFANQLRNKLNDIIGGNPIKQRCSVETSLHSSLKKRMERAGKSGASHVVILAPDELSQGKCAIKTMKTGEQNLCDVMKFVDADFVNNLFNVVRKI